jgi:CO dehydrogenase maturation factor
VGAEPGGPALMYTMNPKVDDIPEKYGVRCGNVRLMVMGTIRRGNSGCACPEHVIIKQLISHLLVERDEVVILDMEAGIEHLNRGTAQFVDALICVVQPAKASIQTFGRIRQLAADLKIAHVGVVANMVRNQADLQRIQAETGCAPWCVLPFAPGLADYTGGQVDQTIVAEIETLVAALKGLSINKKAG